MLDGRAHLILLILEILKHLVNVRQYLRVSIPFILILIARELVLLIVTRRVILGLVNIRRRLFHWLRLVMILEPKLEVICVFKQSVCSVCCFLYELCDFYNFPFLFAHGSIA